MEGNKKKIREVFQDFNLVPEFQRNFSWKTEQSIELFNDIYEAFTSKVENYFSGTIVRIKKNNSRYEICDGQQRLTVYTIFFSVIRNIVEQRKDNPSESIFFSDLDIDSETDSLNKISQFANQMISGTFNSGNRLTLNNKDKDKFIEKIIEDKKIPSRYRSNDPLYVKIKFELFEFLKNEEKLNQNINHFREFILFIHDKVEFFDIIIEDDLEAYTLFESINARGLPLSASELLKNKFLKIGSEDQDKKNKILEIWNTMDENLENSKYDLTEFIRLYWIAFKNKGRHISNKNLYKSVTDKIKNVDQLLEDIQHMEAQSQVFSEWTKKSSYQFLLNNEDTEDSILSEINYLGYKLPWSVLLLLKEKKPDSVKILSKIILIFLFKTVSIAERKIGIANRVLSTVIKMINDDDDNVNILNYVRSQTVDDEDFKKFFLETKNFEGGKNIAKYILIKKDNEVFNMTRTLNYELINLEHILPQSNNHINFYVNKTSLDLANDDDKDKYLNNLGNLIILSKKMNNLFKNSNFEDKKIFFRDSILTPGHRDTNMAHKIFEQPNNNWSIEHIKERNKELYEFINNLMTYPNLSNEN